MKKAKKVVALLLCAVLLVVGSVAGTMAYLADTSDVVENTFTIGKVDITLDEAGVNEYGQYVEITKDGEGNVTDLVMPETSNVLQYFTEDGSKVSVRPSGTEPKVKFYFLVIAKDGNEADSRITAYRKTLNV